MRDLVAKFLFSSAKSLFHNQPDLSGFTSQTNEREPNLSFHLANELWPYLFWLQCDFDVTKPKMSSRRPDVIFHRRGSHSLNWLVVEVKREKNPAGTADDVQKIRDSWFNKPLSYRFGASVCLDETAKTFEIILLDRVAGNEKVVKSGEDFPSVTPKKADMSAMTDAVVRAERERSDLDSRRDELDRAVLKLYAE